MTVNFCNNSKGTFFLAVAIISISFFAFCYSEVLAKNITVNNVKELKDGIRKARAGDVILMSSGEYLLQRKISTFYAGAKGKPIVVRAADLGKVRIKSRSVVAFHIKSPYWIFENLDIEGVCKNHTTCEHAFQITGYADGSIIRNNRLHEYNAMIKLNGGSVKNKSGGRAKTVFPKNIFIEGNKFFNSTVRNTKNPVSFINLDGGRHLVVRNNLIADFAKSQGTKVAYGGFMKGLTRDGVFERNLVICELRHKGYERVGLSFGGGGTPVKIREEPVGDLEALRGIMRNNIILNCPNSIAIYLNKSGDTKIFNNTIYNSYGIDVRFKESTAEIYNNIISGGIRDRDGGESTESENIIAGTSFSHNFPGGMRYLQKRLKGQDKNFPNYVDKEDVEFAQSLVKDALEVVAPTWIGMGTNKVRDMFVDPDNFDFSPSENQKFIDKGIILEEVKSDFCGNPRNAPPHDIGAIEYGEYNCEIGNKVNIE